MSTTVPSQYPSPTVPLYTAISMRIEVRTSQDVYVPVHRPPPVPDLKCLSPIISRAMMDKGGTPSHPCVGAMIGSGEPHFPRPVPQ